MTGSKACWEEKGVGARARQAERRGRHAKTCASLCRV